MCNRYVVLWAISIVVLFSITPNSWASDVHLSGFGTLAYSYEDEEGIGFRRDLAQPYDTTTNGSWLTDSRFGLQLDYSMNPNWRFTLQGVAKKRVSDDWLDVIEIGFVGYQPSERWDIRLGRLPPDAFWATETRNIDFGHNWVRPPIEIYSWLPFQSVDGVDAVYFFYTDEIDWYISSQLGYFHTSVESPAGELVDTSGTELVSLSLKALWGEWRARGSILYSPGVSSEVSFSTQQLVNQLGGVSMMGLGTISQEAQALSRALVVEDEAVMYTQLGLEYFDGTWMVASELVSIHSDSDQVILPSGLGGYVTLSYYVDGWSPYIIASTFSPDLDPQTAAVDWSSISPQLGYLQQQVINGVNLSRIEQQTWSLGLRWDVAKNIALKAQIDLVEIAPNGYGLWANELELNSVETQLELYTLSLNFVF